MPGGYNGNNSACINVLLSAGSCTIINTPGPPPVGGTVELPVFNDTAASAVGDGSGCCDTGFLALLGALRGGVALCTTARVTVWRR